MFSRRHFGGKKLFVTPTINYKNAEILIIDESELHKIHLGGSIVYSNGVFFSDRLISTNDFQVINLGVKVNRKILNEIHDSFFLLDLSGHFVHVK